MRLPEIKSRYVPGAMPVVMVVSWVLGSLLIATKPWAPREKAIALAPLSHQLLIFVPATTCRKLTICRIDGSRCSHTQCPIVAVSRLAAQVTAVVQPFASEGGPM